MTDRPAAAIIKHNNPSGVAEIARDKAYRKLQDRFAFERHGVNWADLKDLGGRQAIQDEVRQLHGGLAGAAMVSDAFFPFRDGVEVGLSEGVSAALSTSPTLRVRSENMSTFDGIEKLDLSVSLPATLVEITQEFDRPRVKDIGSAVQSAFQASGLLSKLPPPSRVAVAVGSRGIANLPAIVKAVVDLLRQGGMDPFVTPAMGSHGGGTADGQISVLSSLGVTPASVGAPVLATMQVKQVGQIPDGPKLYQDLVSASADFTFLISRVKPHTDFHGPLESGLTKMAVIGLGKQIGAAEMHEWGVAGFRRFLTPAARIYEAHSNIIGGLAIVENAYDETARIQALHISELGQAPERQLLEYARRNMPSLAFKDIDVLVVRKLGKNISGTGMDTNIIGRLMIPREPETPVETNIAALVVLDLTEETHGNANGIGLANVTTRRLFDKVDWPVTYTNALTSGIFGMQRVSLPIVMANDRQAIQAAIRGCGRRSPDARLVMIENTLRLDRMWISPNLRPEAEQNRRISIVKPVPLGFSPAASLCSPWEMDDALNPD